MQIPHNRVSDFFPPWLTDGDFGLLSHVPSPPRRPPEDPEEGVREVPPGAGLVIDAITPKEPRRAARFQHKRTALIAEFQPENPTEVADVDLLADDFLRLEDTRRLIKAETTGTLNVRQRDLEDARAHVLAERWLAGSKAIYATVVAGDAPRLTGEQSRTFASDLASMAKAVLEDLREGCAAEMAAHIKSQLAAAQAATRAQPDMAFEKAELAEFRLQGRAVRPVRQLLTEGRIVDVLSGKAVLSDGERHAWEMLLGAAIKHRESVCRGTLDAWNRYLRALRDAEGAFPNCPKRLFALQRFERNLQHGVDKRIARLSKQRDARLKRRPNSFSQTAKVF